MTIGEITYFVFAVLLGACMFVYAGIDDSPGGQLLGVLVGVSGIIVLARGKKNHK